MNLRPPSTVMKLERLGSFHATRISFARTLIRRMQSENWSISEQFNSLDDRGFGDIAYQIDTPDGPLSFVAHSAALDEKDRTDRVIADKWDMSFTLRNGTTSLQDINRLRSELPKQEAGRMSADEIVMSRANKSVRVFNAVVDSLVNGRQPTMESLADIGYLARTTAVYGNGKFGLMDFHWVQRNTPFKLPFQAEMLTVFMVRHFSFKLVQHVADQASKGRAVQLDRNLKRLLGVGNATGLGMAPFLVRHPKLIHQWIKVRECAIERVRSVPWVNEKTQSRYLRLLERIRAHIDQWQTQDERQMARLATLKDEVDALCTQGTERLLTKWPWASLADELEQHASLECIELMHSIMLELYPSLVNELEQDMCAREDGRLEPHSTLLELKTMIETSYAWALRPDYADPDSQHYFWYVSEEKEEPRLGERSEEPGQELELRIGIGREVASVYQCLQSLSSSHLDQSVAVFLRDHPQYRFIVTRIHSLKDFPYGEIRDNLLSKDCLPIDLLRCKLAIFGATRFDPKSDRWTRITLFQGAPLADEIGNQDADDWAFPAVAGF